MNLYRVNLANPRKTLWQGKARGFSEAIDKAINQPDWKDDQEDILPTDKPVQLEIKVWRNGEKYSIGKFHITYTPTIY